MRRLLLALAVLPLSGCVTALTYTLFQEPFPTGGEAAESVQRVAFDGDSVCVVVELEEGEQHVLRAPLAGARDVLYRTWPAVRAEYDGGVNEEVASLAPIKLLRDDGLEEPEDWEGSAAAKQDLPTVYWTEAYEDDASLVLVVVGHGAEPRWILIPDREHWGLNYVPYVLITPVTVGLDLATLPFQLVALILVGTEILDFD